MGRFRIHGAFIIADLYVGNKHARIRAPALRRGRARPGYNAKRLMVPEVADIAENSAKYRTIIYVHNCLLRATALQTGAITEQE
jgi:hypothetical protein